MKKKQQSYPAFHAGVSLLLVIFIILCLVILATLSLSSALRDRSYAEKEAEKMAEYYQADAEAVRILEAVDQTFLSLIQEDTSASAVMAQLSREEYPGGSPVVFSESAQSAGCIQADYTVAINDRQELSVRVLFDTRQSLSEGSYEILTWKEVPSGAWEGDDSLPLME